MFNPILISGMPRSGLHALLGWIKVQIHPHAIDFTNNGKKYRILRAALISKLKKTHLKRAEIYQLKRRHTKALAWLKRNTPNKKRTIAIMEQVNLQVLSEFEREEAPCKITNVLLMRDVFNQYASFMTQKLRRLGSRESKDFSQTYRKYAEEFLGKTEYLEDKILVKYNQWFVDKSYRKKIIEKLGGVFTDANLQQVPAAGGGSSFDKQYYQHKAQEMKVLERWRPFFKEYPNCLGNIDSKCIELSNQIFGNILDI
jgi:hypothetical protein